MGRTRPTLNGDGVRLGPQGTPVEWVEEKSYFFKLSAYQDRLLKLYEEHPDFIGPDARRNEVISFVKGGLQDLSVSRTTFDWGIKVPGAPEHIMYVWVDALTNYITGVGYPDTESRQLPALLAGRCPCHRQGHHPLPRGLLAGLPDLGRSRRAEARLSRTASSSTRGRRCRSRSATSSIRFAITDAYGVDQVRYFFLREVPFGQDGSYSHEAIVQRINADLANDLGNLAQRSLSMIGKNNEGRVPQPAAFTEADRTLLAAADALVGEARTAMKDFALHTMLAGIWRVVADANRYFASEEPWKLKKTDPERMNTVLYVTAEVLRSIAILTQPVTPTASSALLDLLNVPGDARSFAALGEGAAHARHASGSSRADLSALCRAGGGGRERLIPSCSSTATATSIFRTSQRPRRRDRARQSGRRRCDGDDLDAREEVRPDPRDHRTLRQCVRLGRHASAQRGGGTRRHAWPI